MWLKENILERIKNEKIIPLSRYQIMRKYLFLGIFLSLLIGFGIFFVSFFISEAFEIVEFIQLDTIFLMTVWFLLVLIIWMIAYIDMRDIRRLYRYGIWKVMATIFIVILTWWGLVYFTWIWQGMQSLLMRHTSYEKLMIVYASWNKPESGRLIWEVIQIKKWDIYIWNIDEEIWIVKIDRVMYDALDSRGERLFKEGNTLKFTGKITGQNIFTAETATTIFQ